MSTPAVGSVPDGNASDARDAVQGLLVFADSFAGETASRTQQMVSIVGNSNDLDVRYTAGVAAAVARTFIGVVATSNNNASDEVASVVGAKRTAADAELDVLQTEEDAYFKREETRKQQRFKEFTRVNRGFPSSDIALTFFKREEARREEKKSLKTKYDRDGRNCGYSCGYSSNDESNSDDDC
jgi:hypothetical protein